MKGCDKKNKKDFELQAVKETQGAKSRVPWGIVFELFAVLGAASIAIVGLVQSWDSTTEIDFISLAALIVCLAVLSYLLFRQRGALGKADK